MHPSSALCSRCQPSPSSRRDFLAQCGGGFGLLGLTHLLGLEERLAAEDIPADKITSEKITLQQPSLRPRAKAVIQLFMLGGASQCDTFDYKPELIRRHGETVQFTVTGGTAASPGPC